MAKPVKKVATAKRAAKSVSKTAQPPVVRSAAVKQAQIDQSPETAMYEVLEPFKFQGVPVKPPSFIEMTAAEALPYQEAGVLGDAPGEVPTSDVTHDDDESDAGGPAGAGASSTADAGGQGAAGGDQSSNA